MAHTGATGLRLQEAGSINRSLAALSDVIKVTVWAVTHLVLAWFGSTSSPKTCCGIGTVSL